MKLAVPSLRFLSIAVLAVALSSCNTASNTPTNPGGGGGGGGGTPVMSVTVVASGTTFSPSVVNLAAGGTVTFTNAGGLHNVNASGSVNFRCANGCDGQGGNGAPSTATWSFQITFPAPGTTNFVCDEHASVGMSGQIIVQ